nr:MaoC/PaaZ C-terminal domain-containing protein [uncultured Brevundimonas sp.]
MTENDVVERLDAPLSGLAVVGGALRGLLRKTPAQPLLPRRTLQREVVLEARAIDAYARLCGFSTAQGVPVTWPHILSFPLQMRIMLGADFPYPAAGLVHVYNRIRQRARLEVGQRLVLTTRVGPLLAHEKGQAFALTTEVQHDGQFVWEGESIYLKLGRAGRGAAAPELEAPSGPSVLETWSTAPDLGRRYAAVSGDANPIHTSALGARLFGFRLPIAHGMWTKARAIAALTPQAPLEAAEVQAVFRSPVFLGDAIVLHAAPPVRTNNVFEVRDMGGTRTHLRGRLNLSPSLSSQPPEGPSP